MFLGVDVGGTTLSLGLVENNAIIKKITAPSFKRAASIEETVQYLESLIESIITPEVHLIGIGVPSVVDAKQGIVYNALNIPSWNEVHLGEALRNHFNIPVNVNNDANCFALGAAAKVGGGEEIIVGITLGTGIGVGLVVNGKIVNGRNTGVGELCSIPYNGRIIEDFCSKSFFNDHGVNSIALAERAGNGDSHAINLLNTYGRNIGEFVGIVILAYDPCVIVFGGGLANMGKYFKDAMISRLREIVPYPMLLDTLRFEFLPDPDFAIIGASLL